MKKLFILSAIVTVLVFAALTHPVDAHPTMDIVASNWKFMPGTVTVRVGEPTTLRITSSEGVHGLQSAELGIALTTIMPNKFVTVTFTPKQAGTYVLHCAIPCGPGHADMKLLIVAK